MVDRGMTPMQAMQAATLDAAPNSSASTRPRPAGGGPARRHHRRSRDPPTDITVTQDVRFVMKGGQIYRNDS